MHLFLAECMPVYARMIVHLVYVHDCVFAEYPCVHMDVCTWECVRLRAHIAVCWGECIVSVCPCVCVSVSVCVCVFLTVCALDCLQKCLHQCVHMNVCTCECVRLCAHIAVCCG